MNITSITVAAGRTFNHPYESYSNLRPEVRMTADLAEGEDAVQATQELQAKAEALVEQHKSMLLKQIEDLYQSRELDRELAGMEDKIRQAQERMEELKKRRQDIGEVKTLPMAATHEAVEGNDEIGF